MPLDNITELKKRVPGGKYALARAVAERAKQLQNGALPLTEVRTPNHLSVAIDEIVQGKVTFQIDIQEIEEEAQHTNIDELAEGVAAPNAVDEAAKQLGG